MWSFLRFITCPVLIPECAYALTQLDIGQATSIVWRKHVILLKPSLRAFEYIKSTKSECCTLNESPLINLFVGLRKHDWADHADAVVLHYDDLAQRDLIL